MSKAVKNSLLVIVIVILLFIIIWFGYDILKKEPEDTKPVMNNLVDENTGLDNVINELFENVVDNEENTLEDNEKNEDTGNKTSNTTKNTTTNTVSKPTSSETITSKEEKAIELVKEEWGGTEGVYFRNESIDSQGRYIISVHDNRTTNTLAFFMVDVSTGLVTKQ